MRMVMTVCIIIRRQKTHARRPVAINIYFWHCYSIGEFGQGRGHISGDLTLMPQQHTPKICVHWLPDPFHAINVKACHDKRTLRSPMSRTKNILYQFRYISKDLYNKNKLTVKKSWDDNNLLNTLKKYLQFQKCGILKL